MARKFFMKGYILDPEFQYAFIFRNILVLFFAIVALSVVMVVWNRIGINEGFLIHPPSNAQVAAWAKENGVSSNSAEYAYQFIVQAKPYTFFQLIFKPALIVIAAGLLFLSIYGLFLSKKIAGPIYRLKRTLKDKIEGREMHPILFRKDDPFHELSDLFNKAFELKDKLKK